MRLIVMGLGLMGLSLALLAAAAPAPVAPEVGTVIERLAVPAEHDAAVVELTALDAKAGPALVAALADSRDVVRVGAAGVLRTLAKDASKLPNRHERKIWEERMAALHAGMSVNEALAVLMPDLTTEQRSKTMGMGMGTGATSITMYRVDDYWQVTLYTHFGDDKLQAEPPILNARAKDVWAKPPEGFTGVWTTWFVNGQQSYAIQYKDGKYDGLFEAFKDDGTKAYEQRDVAGVAEGADTGWSAPGKKSYEGQYAGGKQEGKWNFWYPDGKPQSEMTYKAGQLDGVYTRWFANGQKQSEEHYVLGKKEGLDTAWDEQGTLLWKRVYRIDRVVE